MLRQYLFELTVAELWAFLADIWDPGISAYGHILRVMIMDELRIRRVWAE